MKRRLTYFAAVLVVADVLALGAAWQAGPALGLTVALAVPEVESVLGRLYAEPTRAHVRVPAGDGSVPAIVYRSAEPRSAIVLNLDGPADDAEIARVATTLARRGVAVVVPDASDSAAGAPESVLAFAKTLGVPARVETLGALGVTAAATAPAARAGEAVRLLRLATSILSTR
jgi:hypothetical protein